MNTIQSSSNRPAYTPARPRVSGDTSSPDRFEAVGPQAKRFDPWSQSRVHLEEGVADLAGPPPDHPNPLQMQQRMATLVDKLLAPEILTARLHDLKSQFSQPLDRPWDGPIRFKDINQDMIVGVDPKVFLAVLNGASQIEDPIKNYAKESHDYLADLHPELATFMGGTYDVEGKATSEGVWHKEERRHNPLFSKLYEQLAGHKTAENPNSVNDAVHTDDPRADVRRHGVSRVATEWAATSGYIWLMGHSTDELQYAIAQAAQDEINHFAKFWGYMKHAYPEKNFVQTTMEIAASLTHLVSHNAGERKLGGSEAPQKSDLSIKDLIYAPEAASVYAKTMGKMAAWDRTLNAENLGYLFAKA